MENTTYYGKVIHGLHNGESFGFPTANVLLNQPCTIAYGVYAVTVSIDNQTLKGMLYVGTRPTLNLSEQSLEINIFDFSGDLYDRDIAFTIVAKIRDEVKFNNVDELIRQLHQDKQDTLECLAQRF